MINSQDSAIAKKHLPELNHHRQMIQQRICSQTCLPVHTHFLQRPRGSSDPPSPFVSHLYAFVIISCVNVALRLYCIVGNFHGRDFFANCLEVKFCGEQFLKAQLTTPTILTFRKEKICERSPIHEICENSLPRKFSAIWYICVMVGCICACVCVCACVLAHAHNRDSVILVLEAAALI